MNRRSFLASSSLGLAGPAFSGLFPSRAAPPEPSTDAAAAPPAAQPTAAQVAWQNLEIGMFIHFAPNTWQEREYDDHSTPLSGIHPQIDTEQWVEAAQSLGARYIVFVAKHAGGFCMWQTQTTEYSIRNTPWRGGQGDVMAELSASCRKHGLGLGVYLSPRDDDAGAAGGGKCATPEKQSMYNARYRQQLTELLTRYGSMVEIWFDGSIVVPAGDILSQHAPHAMIFQGPHATIRWVGNEDGFAPYPAWNGIARSDARTGEATALHGDPDGDAWLPNEVDVSLRRPNWFWSSTNHANILSVDALLEIYYRSVGRGTQLLLNVTPDRRGLIPGADMARLREFGADITRRFGKSTAETAGHGGSLTLALPAAAPVDHILLQEELSHGERVREYQIEGRVQGKWMTLGRGSSIGHKRIHPVEPVAADRLRFTALKANGTPQLRRFAAFSTGAAPPQSWNAPAKCWADNDVGRWKDFVFALDITKHITSTGEYRLRGVADGEAVAELAGVELVSDGVPGLSAVRVWRTRRDVQHLLFSSVPRKTILRGRLRGASSGTLLLRKLN